MIYKKQNDNTKIKNKMLKQIPFENMKKGKQYIIINLNNTLHPFSLGTYDGFNDNINKSLKIKYIAKFIDFCHLHIDNNKFTKYYGMKNRIYELNGKAWIESVFINNNIHFYLFDTNKIHTIK
jgi:hypothetical protein